MAQKNVKWIAFSLFLISLGYFALFIQYPKKLYWDETIHTRGAQKILEGKGPYKDQMHPPLGRELLVASMYLFGESPTGARGLSVLAGAGTIALIFLIAFNLNSRCHPRLDIPSIFFEGRMGSREAGTHTLDPRLKMNTRGGDDSGEKEHSWRG